jgi:hypothetical protein
LGGAECEEREEQSESFHSQGISYACYEC